MQRISLKYLSPQENKEILTEFLSELWMAPADVLLRATETALWRNFSFTEPTLDIGCGDGTISTHIFKHLPPLAMGVDLNPEGALKTGRYKKVQTADATDLPFADNSFQTVVSNSTFEHIDHDIQAVGEVSRVLKKGGTFWLTVPTPVLKRQLQRLSGSEEKFRKINDRIAHYHYRSLQEWEIIYKKQGLQLTAQQPYFSPEHVRVWLSLFEKATFKPYNRELWSYAADPRFSPLVPKTALKTLELQFLLPQLSRSLAHPQGCWQLLKAIKV